MEDIFGGASNLSAGVDKAFIFIFVISVIFIVGITAFMIWTVVKFSRKKGKAAQQFTHNNTLEVVWTVIPTIIVLVMFWYGWKGFKPMRSAPEDAMEIQVNGRYWEWDFDYGEGKISKELVLPINKPVKLNLVSEDVNHSFFIPAFRVKEDVVPGYNNWLWFVPTEKGKYEILCTEYCGLDHSGMIAYANVVEEAEFNTWLDTLVATGNIPDPEGLTVLKNNACISCHSMDGKKIVGPSFKGLYGSEKVVVEDGQEKTIIVDDAYLIQSIKDPNAQVVKGYNKGLMQSYDGVISDEDIQKIVDYLRTVK